MELLDVCCVYVYVEREVTSDFGLSVKEQIRGLWLKGLRCLDYECMQCCIVRPTQLRLGLTHKVGDYPGSRRLLLLVYVDLTHDTHYSPTLGSVSCISRLRLDFTHKVGDYPGSRRLSNMHDFGGTNRIVSQCQFNIDKVGDYPGSRRFLKV